MKMMKKDSLTALKSVLVITMGLLLLNLVFHWKWALFASLFIGISGVLSGFVADKIHYLWMKLAYLLNLVFSNLLLTLVFYLILTPIAFLYRLFRRQDALLLKRNPGSTFFIKQRTFNADDFVNPW
jgi:hypothetical protein